MYESPKPFPFAAFLAGHLGVPVELFYAPTSPSLRVVEERERRKFVFHNDGHPNQLPCPAIGDRRKRDEAALRRRAYLYRDFILTGSSHEFHPRLAGRLLGIAPPSPRRTEEWKRPSP